MAAKVSILTEEGERILLGYSYDQVTHYSLLELAARKAGTLTVLVEPVRNGREVLVSSEVN